MSNISQTVDNNPIDSSGILYALKKLIREKLSPILRRLYQNDRSPSGTPSSDHS